MAFDLKLNLENCQQTSMMDSETGTLLSFGQGADWGKEADFFFFLEPYEAELAA